MPFDAIKNFLAENAMKFVDQEGDFLLLLKLKIIRTILYTSSASITRTKPILP